MAEWPAPVGPGGVPPPEPGEARFAARREEDATMEELLKILAAATHCPNETRPPRSLAMLCAPRGERSRPLAAAPRSIGRYQWPHALPAPRPDREIASP